MKKKNQVFLNGKQLYFLLYKEKFKVPLWVLIKLERIDNE